jgi:hypothetical protein
LEFSVNDAIALAHEFSLGLRLIPPGQVNLALSGEPTTAAARRQFEELRLAGASVTGGTRDEIISAIERSSRMATDPECMVFVSISTHGFQKNNTVYFMPNEGRSAPTSVGATGIEIDALRSALTGNNPQRKMLLIVDACREKIDDSSKGGGGTDRNLADAFQAEFREAQGTAVLMSCADAQQSFEDSTLGNGVYTHSLVAALRSAPADFDGFIRIGEVATRAEIETTKWATSRGLRQTPVYAGSDSGQKIPLAIDPSAVARFSMQKQQAKDLLKQVASAHPTIYFPELRLELEEAIDRIADPRLNDVVSRLDDARNEPQNEQPFQLVHLKKLLGIGVATIAAGTESTPAIIESATKVTVAPQAGETTSGIAVTGAASNSIRLWFWLLPLLFAVIVVAALMLRPQKAVAHASATAVAAPIGVTPPVVGPVVGAFQRPVAAPTIPPKDRLRAALGAAIVAPAAYPSSVWTEHSTATPPSSRDLGVVQRHEEHAWARGQRVRICFQPGAAGYVTMILFGSSGRVQLVCPNTAVEGGRVRVFPDSQSAFEQKGTPEEVDLLYAIASPHAQGWAPSLKGRHLLRYLDDAELAELANHFEGGALRGAAVSSTSWRARG